MKSAVLFSLCLAPCTLRLSSIRNPKSTIYSMAPAPCPMPKQLGGINRTFPYRHGRLLQRLGKGRMPVDSPGNVF